MPETDEIMALVCPDADRLVRFHVVVAGRCFVRVGDETVWLRARDVIVLPHDDPHVLGSAEGLPPVPVLSALAKLPSIEGELPCLSNLGGAHATTILCGFLAFDEPIFDPVISALPRVIVDSTDPSASRSWFDAMLDYVIHRDGGAPRSGWQAMQTRLVELMFIEVVRRHVAGLPEGNASWLGALRNPQIGRAVAELHADPARAWTVASLAKRVGLSRSVLAERFRSATGLAPMQYLGAWRLQLAAGFMRRGELSIAQAAARVGYKSKPFTARSSAWSASHRRVARAHGRHETDARARKPDVRAYP